MRYFHLACPYTSLPVCHCRLFVAAPPRFSRDPFKHVAPRNENAWRRAQLLELLSATRAPAGARQTPSAGLIHAMHHRAAYGRSLRRRRGRRVATHQAALAAISDLNDEDAFVSATDRLRDAKEELYRAEEQVRRAVAAVEVEEVDANDAATANDRPLQLDNDLSHNPDHNEEGNPDYSLNLNAPESSHSQYRNDREDVDGDDRTASSEDGSSDNDGDDNNFNHHQRRRHRRPYRRLHQ